VHESPYLEPEKLYSGFRYLRNPRIFSLLRLCLSVHTNSSSSEESKDSTQSVKSLTFKLRQLVSSEATLGQAFANEGPVLSKDRRILRDH
jgi:hypothetical protein